MEKANYTTFKQGVDACIPTILGYAGIGIAAGVVGKSVGLSVIEIACMSILVYAGSAQFIICGMLALRSPISAIVLTTFLVNLRHFLMSMSVAPYFKEEKIITTLGIGSLLTDESYGVLVTCLQKEGKISVRFVHGLNITAYIAWILATVIGGIVGQWIPNPTVLGLDFALIAMFIGLFVLQIDEPLKQRAKPTIVLVVSVCLLVYLLMGVFSAEIAVLFSTILGCLIGMVVYNDK